MATGSNLSKYEELRLANIKKNQEFLASLGLESAKPKPLKVTKTQTVKTRDIASTTSAPKRIKRDIPVLQPTRKSRRLQNLEDVKAIEEDEAEIEIEKENLDNIIDYGSIPTDSTHLDDDEFEVYAAVVAWRLKRCREITEEKGEMFEPYKIFQNRTLCEVVRRKRNNLSWGNPSAVTSDEELSSMIKECWGIGDIKAGVGGFGRELVAFIDEDVNLIELLRQSQNRDKGTRNNSQT